MDAFFPPAVALAVGFALSLLPREPENRTRLRAWLWPVPGAWALIIAWALIHYDADQAASNWVLETLWAGGPLIVGLAAVLSVFKTVRQQTWFYVLPFLAVSCGYAANTLLLAYMGLKHAYF